MVTLMIILFLIGYACIALEHNLKINKAATALLLSSLLWTIYIFYAQSFLPNEDEFIKFNAGSPDIFHNIIRYVTEVQIIEHIGDVAEIIFFLLGAMTIVELIDVHGGFSIITDKITTKNKKSLLWTLSIITFFMSAILDNLTTTIVMVMLLRKLVADQRERWLFACAIIIAANSGGAFSPIGDVTTIMLWVKGNVTTQHLIPSLLGPSIVSALLPVLCISFMLKGELKAVTTEHSSTHTLKASEIITPFEQKFIFFLGVGCLIFVPIFKSITHLPPFLGVLLGLGALWIYTEKMYGRKKNVPESSKARISVILGRIDFTTILFFLGILMAVASLQCAGILHELSLLLEEKLQNIYLINLLIGVLSSIVDNVPLVAGAMGMYEIAPVGCEESLIPFMQDGTFWLFLTYCAGVGGSILIIGSAAGVVVMGLEKVDFVWYLKHISFFALLGYLAGALFYILQEAYILG
ncbi:MAG: sodium:proton antiporter NhaD [Paludibacteraceae bacterium]|nr:sodium:proton antiporter NhaD [Paludibacteraceae bacterium]